MLVERGLFEIRKCIGKEVILHYLEGKLFGDLVERSEDFFIEALLREDTGVYFLAGFDDKCYRVVSFGYTFPEGDEVKCGYISRIRDKKDEVDLELITPEDFHLGRYQIDINHTGFEVYVTSKIDVNPYLKKDYLVWKKLERVF